MVIKQYLDDATNLSRGSVDDRGDAQYTKLTQNVPNGFVYDLQTDLISLGFSEIGKPDGAFGNQTKIVVQTFQKMARLETTGIVDRSTKDEIRMWLQHGYTKARPPQDSKPGAPEQKNGYQLIAPRIPHFSQGDARWAQKVLGKQSSIARQGCAISSVAMVLKFHGRNVTPGALDDFLDKNAGYSGDSVKWDVAGRCSEGGSGRLKYARMTGSASDLQAALSKRIDRNLPTLVRVDYAVDADLTYNHFVVAVGKTADGLFIMNDPATSQGDGYANPGPENIIQKTTRKGGYRIVQLDWYDL